MVQFQYQNLPVPKCLALFPCNEVHMKIVSVMLWYVWGWHSGVMVSMVASP